MNNQSEKRDTYKTIYVCYFQEELMESLTINVKNLKRVDLVEVKGRVDSSNASQLDNTFKGLAEQGRHNLVVDLSEVNYMSSAGIRALVSALRENRKHNGDVYLAQLSTRVEEVLTLAGLETLFQSYPDAATAVGNY